MTIMFSHAHTTVSFVAPLGVQLMDIWWNMTNGGETIYTTQELDYTYGEDGNYKQRQIVNSKSPGLIIAILYVHVVRPFRLIVGAPMYEQQH